MLGFYLHPPTTNAFSDVPMAISPDALEVALRQWINVVIVDELEAIAIDGKTLCSTIGEHCCSIELLALLDQQTG